ncbi:hypothetical protein E3N88_18767 [Mikania micrantha]|uniref:Leucine-rich repeat-containing N-terminal plant-type domain-containing protein n=1 Tax=Mikania micrantha TaxID=192012 RepID=A0A5N6NLB6_9ASTR|nr:hypothetical protein E3N88_18767 [Mikania micrantha]
MIHRRLGEGRGRCGLRGNVDGSLLMLSPVQSTITLRNSSAWRCCGGRRCGWLLVAFSSRLHGGFWVKLGFWCYFEGEIPRGYGGFQMLKFLYLVGNSLEGEIPAELGFITSLEHLEIGYNASSGHIPTQ